MRCFILIVILASALPRAVTAAPGADAGRYVRVELGLGLAPDIGLHTRDDDRPARCDGFINPEFALLEGCSLPDRSIDAVDEWGSNFADTDGILAGIALGRNIGRRLRTEWEYSFQEYDYEQTAPILSPSGPSYASLFGAELPRAEERIGSLRAHSLFVNLYLDFSNKTRFTPYIGAGIGVGLVAMDYSALWLRASDPALMETARGLPNEAEVRANLAGTATMAQKTLRDELGGYQLIAGVDYRLSTSWSLGIKGRWADFRSLQDGGAYQPLRGHVSNLRRDGSEPVVYRVRNPDTHFFAFSVNLTYLF